MSWTGEILIVRHGRTDWNAEGRFLGRTDRPLDALGRAQAAALATEVGLTDDDLLVSSPLRRARETAAALGREPAIDEDLRELDQGALEGLTPREALAAHPAFFAAWAEDPGAVVVPGGEGLRAARDRAAAAVARWQARAPGGRLVVVAHQLVLSALAATWAGEPLARWRRWRLEETGRRAVRIGDGVVRVGPAVEAPPIDLR